MGFFEPWEHRKKQQKPQVSTGENSWFRKWKWVILRFIFLSKVFSFSEFNNNIEI